MMTDSQTKKTASAREKMRRYRQRLRAAGLRPVQIWVPDTRAESFAQVAREQSLRASQAPGEADEIAFTETVQSANLDLPEP